MASPVVVTRIQNRRGTQVQFDGLYPPGYDGTGGFGSIPGFNITNFPSVLVSGEIAFCTDTRKIYMGNINGEYVEVGKSADTGLLLLPIVVALPPAAVFTHIAALDYDATPFLKIPYSATDSPSPNWNVVGSDFSRNGELEITAVVDFIPAPPVPPFPPITPVTLTDTHTEINLVQPNSLKFIAQYDVTKTLIEIHYMHDFATSLTLSSSFIKWVDF